jgi:hypothetical protein
LPAPGAAAARAVAVPGADAVGELTDGDRADDDGRVGVLTPVDLLDVDDDRGVE